MQPGHSRRLGTDRSPVDRIGVILTELLDFFPGGEYVRLFAFVSAPIPGHACANVDQVAGVIQAYADEIDPRPESLRFVRNLA